MGGGLRSADVLFLRIAIEPEHGSLGAAVEGLIDMVEIVGG